MRVGALVLRAFAGALAVLVCISHVVETRQAPAGRLRAAAARMEIVSTAVNLMRRAGGGLQ
jgi:hypothetical protein